MGMFCINKSGKTINVWQNAGDGEIVGVIYPNECFNYVSRWAGSDAYYPAVCDYIMFRHNGGLMNGYIINDGTGVETSVLNYSFPTVTVGGVTYKCLKARTALGIYSNTGAGLGSCVAGARILTNSTQPGATKNYLVSAKYYETGVGTGVFTPIKTNGELGGFVNSGLSVGSMYNTVGLYGNW